MSENADLSLSLFLSLSISPEIRSGRFVRRSIDGVRMRGGHIRLN